jgi:predicted TPR repeat methyltransferase
MSNLYTSEYAALQSRFHVDRVDYGVSGARYADQILQMAKRLGTRDLLDYGCGKCTLQKALPFPITNYDPFIPEHAARPEPADFVICTDVMEHVEPMHVDDVLLDIRDLMKRAGFFQIATGPASKTLPDGRNAHLIQEPMNWWIARLMTYFEIKSAMVVDHGFVAVVAPLPAYSNSGPVVC